MVENVGMQPEEAAQFLLSQEGSLVYVSGGAAHPLSKLVWVNRQGEAEPCSRLLGRISIPLSPQLAGFGCNESSWAYNFSNREIKMKILDL